jgi:hypothetical protein
MRVNTGSRTVTTYSMPSAWLASCCRPYKKGDYGCNSSCRTRERRFLSHFGYSQTVPGGWKFNVLHVGGSVDDEVWMEVLLMQNADEWHFVRGDGNPANTPYGWDLNNPGRLGYREGVHSIPGFPRPFDCFK